MKSQHKNDDKHDDLIAWNTPPQKKEKKNTFMLPIFQVFRIIIFKTLTLIQRYPKISEPYLTYPKSPPE